MNTDCFDALNFFDEFDKIKENDPGKVVLSEGPKETDITVLELDDLSARVYRFLKERNIGKEDMVNIFLPRGCAILICLFGVWKAGAAATILEDDYPKERVDYIRKDCSCRLVIDIEAWDTILNTEPLKGHEPLDLHAAAFAVYTSGTTGNPKGVLHEYGKIALCYKTSHWDGAFFRSDDVFPLFFPMNFVPAIMIETYLLINGLLVMVIPDHIRKDPNALRQFFIEHRVSSAYFPPSLYRSMRDLGPYLKTLYMCSEPANGIWGDPEKILIMNGYASSETAASVTATLLDKPYDIAPIGHELPGMKVYILDENGKEVKPGEAGEFCCEMPYTRGYINLPEENARTFVDGIYHTGDLAKLKEDGNYYLIGRIKDTVSINGKRVEPSEVEAVIRKVTGIEQIAVRGFSGENGSFLSAYHLGDNDLNIDSLKEMLKEQIPYYMIPSFFVRLKAFPINANGKLDRKALPKPSVMDYLSDYKAPANDIEKALCACMQKILSIPRIGINDDFFLLGGNSLLALKLIVELGLERLGVEDVYAGKTPRGIAEIYNNKEYLSSVDIDEAEKKCREIPLGLSRHQQDIFDYQKLSPQSCMYNISALFRVSGISAKELAGALSRVIENHPVLMTVLREDESGKILQHYAPELMGEISVEEISDEKLLEIKDDLTQPFEILDHPLCRCRVFSTPTAAYFFLDFHHIICDGFSATIIADDIAKALSGEALAKDHYYYVLSKRMEENAHMSRAKEYFESKYSDTSWTKQLPYDYELPGNPAEYTEVSLDISKREYDNLKENMGLGKNSLFIAAGLLALAAVSKAPDVMVSWVYNARTNIEEMNIVGVLFNDLPVALHINDALLMKDAIEDIRDQIDKGIEFSVYPYLRIEFPEVVVDDSICIMYQSDFYDFKINSKYSIEQIDIEEKNRTAQNILDLEIVDDEDGDYLLMDYPVRFYKKETVENYAYLVRKIAKRIIGSKDLGHITVGEFLDQLYP